MPNQIGYDPDFIQDGIRIPLPTFSRRLGQSVQRSDDLRDRQFSDHPNFSLVMNEGTRQLIYSAQNIDQSKFLKNTAGKGKRNWRNDKNYPGDQQLGNKYYEDRKRPNGEKLPNPYDKGHMVMRFNNMWGSATEADAAGKATYIYTNASLQHENLNQDEWRGVEEDIVRDFQDDANDRLIVFTGPIYGDLDRHVNLSDTDSARVPSGFFKVLCFRRKTDVAAEKLGVLAFAIFQDQEVLRDRQGRKQVKTNRSYQVTIKELQDLTGINFGRKLYNANPLFYHNKKARNRDFNVLETPERIPVAEGRDVVDRPDRRRPSDTHLKSRRIVINSAMIDPKGRETTGEWVSLHNRGNRKTAIKQWRLVDGQNREVLLSGTIESGESIRLKGAALGKLRLPNNGGRLSLYDRDGCLIDHVTWSRAQVSRNEEGVAYLFDRETN